MLEEYREKPGHEGYLDEAGHKRYLIYICILTPITILVGYLFYTLV